MRGWELEPVDFELAVPGEHNRRTRRLRSPRSSSPACRGPQPPRRSRRSTGVGRRFELVGEAGGIDVYDDYAHNPAEARALRSRPRGSGADGRVLVLFQPHLYSRTQHPAAELGRELAAADVVAVTDVYPAREQPLDGRHRQARRRRAVRRPARVRARAGLPASRTERVSSPAARGRATSC